MKIGIIQPYFLPYLGYFALINAVDKFVYYDDVQYIKRGWVNRNRIKMGNKWLYITIPIRKAPLSAKINEVFITNNKNDIKKIQKTIEHSYRKSENFENIFNLIFKDIRLNTKISKLNIDLTSRICKYLDITTEMYISSNIEQDSYLKGEEKIINLCKKLNCKYYINPIGGLELYSRENFKKNGLKLGFLKMQEIIYPQGKNEFIANLSIIDVLMWNSKSKIREYLNKFKFI